MCDAENQVNDIEQNDVQRRSFLKLSAASMLGIGLALSESVHATSGMVKTPLPEKLLYV